MNGAVQLVESAGATATRSTSVAILGGSGFTGGELLRLLLQHPGAEVVGATSGRLAGQPLHRAHPNLRGYTDLRFLPRDGLPDADVVFSCLPHHQSAQAVAALHDQGTHVIDLSADFRLREPAAYEHWYGTPHPRPDLLPEAVYGLPETHRGEIAATGRRQPSSGSGAIVSGVGCVATAMNLALLPLADAGLLDGARVVVDAKIGSSAAGAEVNEAGMHAHRSRSMRLYAPTGHRHAAEVQQECGVLPEVSVHATELVRGVLATCHVLLDGPAPAEVDLWKAYRARYHEEPFVRIVKERQGTHRGPDPKLVLGSNIADVGFHAAPATVGAGGGHHDAVGGRPATASAPSNPGAASGGERRGQGGRIVATCALDNLVKGAAGSAVQCFNLLTGQPETLGLLQIPVGPQ